MSIYSVKRTGNVITAETNAALSASVGAIRPSAVNLQVNTNLSGFGVTGVIGESYNTSVFTSSVTANKTARSQPQLTSTASETVTAKRTRSVSINLIANAGKLIEGRRIKYGQANLNVNSTLLANAGVNLIIINQTLFNQATLTAAVRAIHIDPYTTWMVAEEDRTRKVGGEIRTRLIEEETRTYIIEGA